MPTLNWLLENSGLNNLRLVTGINQADNEIRSVNILDNPDVLKWLKRDELVLTTGFIFKDNPDLQRSIIRDMKETGCAALGVKIRRFFHSIPYDMLDEATKLDFPIIELPFFYGFSEISQQVFQQIYQENKDQPQREQDFLLQFMNDLLRHEPLANLLQQLTAYLTMPVLLLDIGYTPLTITQSQTANLLSAEVMQKLTALLVNYALDKTTPLAAEHNGQSLFLQILSLPNQIGYLCFIHKEHDFVETATDFQQKILQLVALGCEQSNISRLNYENRSAFFLHFLMHADENIEETKNICAFYGFNYNKAWICLTISLQDFPAETKPSLLHTLRSLLTDYTPNNATAFICSNDNLLSCFFLFNQDCHQLQAIHSVQAKVQSLHERLHIITAIPLYIGISGCHTNLKDIRQAFRESLTAVNLQHQLKKAEPASYLHHLPEHLLSAYNKELTQLLRHNVLQPLLDFDNTSNTELLHTLQVYLDCNYNASAAAKELFLHRNTMMNRLEKIKEVLDINFSNSQENFLLYLSLLSMQLDK